GRRRKPPTPHRLVEGRRRSRRRVDRRHRGGARSRQQRAIVRPASYDEGPGARPRPVDLPQDHQCPRRTPMGREQRDARRDVHLYASAAPILPIASEQLKASSSELVHVVDDDQAVRESLGDLLQSVNYRVAVHSSASEFLHGERPDPPACLVLDVRLPGTSGLELQAYLTRVNIRLPVILITGFGDIPMSVKGMKAGAVDFLTKPIRDQDLL